MAFKIKDGVRIGTVDVFNNSGTLLVNAPTATQVNNALTVGSGLTLSSGTTYNGSTAVTVSHADTSTAANLTANGRTYVTGLTFDTYGHVTGYTTGTETVTDTNTTYDIRAVTTTGGAFVRLTAGGSGSGTDDIKLASGSNVTVAYTDDNTITISAAAPAYSAGTGLTLNGSTFNHTNSVTAGSASEGGATRTLAFGGTFNVPTVTYDAQGHVTGTGSVTLTLPANPDTNTTYDISAVTGGKLRLTSSSATTDDVTFVGSGLVTVTTTDANTITIGATYTETDTLSSVTGRGATTATAISLTNATASTTTSTGALVVTGGVGIGGAINVGGAASVGGNLTVTGNLIVNGTTTTVNSTVTTIDDPVITLGGDTAPASDDGKDRGVEFRWHNGSVAKLGFFGFDDSTGKFTFIPDATNTSEVFSGTKGEIDANIAWSNVTGSTTAGSNLVTLTNPGAITFLRINADNTVSALDAATFRTAIGAGTGNGSVTSIATNNGITGGTITTTGTIGLTGQALALHNLASNGFIVRTAADTVTARTLVAGTNITITNADGIAGNPTISASFTETDTLATVTARGNKTNTAIVLQESTTDISERQAFTETVATTTITAVDSWPSASYRSAKYLIQITQGTNYQVSEVLVIYSGSTTYMTEYAVLETSGPLGTFTSDVSGGNIRLLVTMGAATSATIKIDRTLITV